jgi:hypothetical protein
MRTPYTMLALIVLAVFLLTGCPEKTAETPPEPEAPEITATDMDAMTVVYIEKKGPYGETGKAMEELLGLMKKKELKMRNNPMACYYDDPSTVDPKETRYPHTRKCMAGSQKIAMSPVVHPLSDT